MWLLDNTREHIRICFDARRHGQKNCEGGAAIELQKKDSRNRSRCIWVQVQGTTVIKIVRVAPPNLPPEGAWLDHSAALHLEKCSVSFAAVRMPQNCLDRPKVTYYVAHILQCEVYLLPLVCEPSPCSSETASSFWDGSGGRAFHGVAVG